MKCDKCGQEETGRGKSIVIYYGSIISQRTEKSHPRPLLEKTTHTTTYSKVDHVGIHICDACLSDYRKKKYISLPLKWLIGFSPYIFIGFASGMYATTLIFCVPAFLALIYSSRALMTRKYQDKPHKYDAYPLGKKLLREQLKSRHPKVKYTFWKSYPKNLRKTHY